jgi:CD2 antigen cytoplasmic tail-binding protein 2
MSLQFDPNNPLRVMRVDESENESEEEMEINSKKKRRTIDTTAYDDDSDNEDLFDSDREDIPIAETIERKEDRDDSDMFSDSDDEKEKLIKKRGVQLMDMEQFEKENEITKRNHAHQSDTDGASGSDDGNQDPKMDAFNLRNEMQQGAFTETGEYYEAQLSQDEDEVWQTAKKREIKHAKLAQDQLDKQALEKRKVRKSNPEYATERLLFRLIGLLKPVESPMEALQRLNKLKRKKGGRKAEYSEEEKLKEKERQTAVTDITECCESLVEQGLQDIYELEKEELMIKYRQESGQTYVNPRKEFTKSESPKQVPGTEQAQRWEFRWIGDSTVHGPYSTAEMSYWKQNYFQDRVEVRPLGADGFTNVSKISFN